MPPAAAASAAAAAAPGEDAAAPSRRAGVAMLDSPPMMDIHVEVVHVVVNVFIWQGDYRPGLRNVEVSEVAAANAATAATGATAAASAATVTTITIAGTAAAATSPRPRMIRMWASSRIVGSTII